CSNCRARGSATELSSGRWLATWGIRRSGLRDITCLPGWITVACAPVSHTLTGLCRKRRTLSARSAATGAFAGVSNVHSAPSGGGGILPTRRVTRSACCRPDKPVKCEPVRIFRVVPASKVKTRHPITRPRLRGEPHASLHAHHSHGCFHYSFHLPDGCLSG